MIYWRMRSNKKFSKQETAFWVLFAGMAVYYGWRLFALTPWYDELYTYYFFISKGPVYAAIHWPLPNNHVGYSVLSAVLDLFGNAYIGLRGVSYLCALANLYLVFRIAGRWMKGYLPLIAAGLYVSMDLVNQMAVQGRGYTLGITCFLTAFYCMTELCGSGKISKRYYIFYIGSLTLGLYAVTSNVYWVVPLCLSGGIYLLVLSIGQAKAENVNFLKTSFGKGLVRLILASVMAAVLTVGLYTVIWMAIGSNLLVKDAASMYYGLSHGKMILSAPFAAIGRGMEYMLDTPYIQSEERAGFAGRLLEFLVTLSGYYFRAAYLVAAIWAAGVTSLFWKLACRLRGKNTEGMLLELMLVLEILFVPICLLIQCKRPYYRVFTYGGVLLCLLAAWLLKEALHIIQTRWKRDLDLEKSSFVFLVFAAAILVKCLFFSGYENQYGDREHEIETVLSRADITEGKTYCVTDCNQQYLLYFLYGVRCENREIEGADLVVLDKRMADPEFDEMVWEFYHYYQDIPWDYIEDSMNLVYESDHYLLYSK